MATQQEDKLKERRERITKGLAEKRFTQTQPPIKAYAFNTERSIEGLRTSILNHLKFTLARTPIGARPRDWWLCLSYSIRDRILERLLATQESHHKNNVRRAYYFSLEYLMGRLLDNNLWNLGMHDDAVLALKEIDLDLSQIEEEEPDMGLGNGGLGRLAACFLDSLATLEYAAVGYGIYYEFGLFKQEFIDHQQVEKPDHWLQMGNPWLVVRPEYKQEIPLFGRVIDDFDDRGDYRPMWVDTKKLIGVPWDLPIVGYGARTVNYLRLWESRASEEFDLQVFNEGGYVEAVREKAIGETISKVLYPSDKTESGRELRLQQEYFFVACSLRDIIRNHFRDNTSWDSFPEKVTVQLNDTHPAISIAEFMRLLVDDERLDWDFAWDMCQKVFAYTNHTLMPEALEKWSVSVFEKILPRHLQIIYEINRRFLEHIVEAKWPGNDEKKKVLSIIEDHHGEKMVRMSYLSIVGSHSVNGVAFLHTELLKKDLFADFYALFPEKFNNKTNGITPRRWLKACNPLLSKLITKKIGDNWITNLDELRKLEQYADNEEFQKDFMTVKHTNKEHLAHIIKEECGIEVDPIAIFDVQIKRLHEYKRQHLNLLHILTLYRKLLHEPNFDMHPRVFIFAAKAAPGYEIAKEIIHAINAAGE
ncbi:MAG: glycogen phosphorylase, partial [Verrucomicrobia bacterium CG_4_10_14_3_um_filter_43_23]